MSSFERKISEPEIEEVDRERSSTVLTHTQSLIEQSLALKHKPNLEVISTEAVANVRRQAQGQGGL